MFGFFKRTLGQNMETNGMPQSTTAEQAQIPLPNKLSPKEFEEFVQLLKDVATGKLVMDELYTQQAQKILQELPMLQSFMRSIYKMEFELYHAPSYISQIDPKRSFITGLACPLRLLNLGVIYLQNREIDENRPHFWINWSQGPIDFDSRFPHILFSFGRSEDHEKLTQHMYSNMLCDALPPTLPFTDEHQNEDLQDHNLTLPTKSNSDTLTSLKNTDLAFEVNHQEPEQYQKPLEDQLATTLLPELKLQQVRDVMQSTFGMHDRISTLQAAARYGYFISSRFDAYLEPKLQVIKRAWIDSGRPPRTKTALAYDTCYVANILTIGADVGYLEQDEVLSLFNEIGELVRQRFSSWEEYGAALQEQIESTVFNDQNYKDSLLIAKEQLKTCKYSPWNEMINPWPIFGW